jgi:hypothetical protein
MKREALIEELQELISAIDRRVPRVEQAGEAAIARDAARLRATAQARLAELLDPDAPAGGSPPSASSDASPGDL